MKEPDSIGERLVRLLKKNGYASDRSKYGVDVSRFTREHGIVITLAFKWLANESRPSDENVLMLAEILNVPPGYILFGEENTVRPIGGGSADATPHPLPLLDDVLPLIRHWLTTGWGWLRLDAPGWSVVYTRSCAA